MTTSDLAARIRLRADAAGLPVTDRVVAGLGAYYAELCRWNAAINLTALRLESEGTDDSIDKLLIEPLAGAAYLPEGTASLIDVGSGGGSPAIPLKLVRPDLAFCMVESRRKKAVFLRRVSRQLGLEGVSVEQAWLQDLSRRPELEHEFAVASLRAVRITEELVQSLAVLLKPNSPVLYFAAGGSSSWELAPFFSKVLDVPLLAATKSRLVVFRSANVSRETVQGSGSA
jgi:16S rRNA (guanine527-N7)-methyltransferase